MLPTYWFTDAGQIRRQNNAYTSQVWMAVTYGDTPAGTYGIVVQRVSDAELTYPGEFTATTVVMLELLLDALAQEGASLTPELAREFPRRSDPVPPEFTTVTLDVLDIDGHLTMAQKIGFGQLHAFITIHDGHWICVLGPSGVRPKVTSIKSPPESSWQRSADAGPPPSDCV